ncbi:hypothetical protein PFLUV_G00015710 [Perca fluviatilis]|uniref:Uncharacterized protein n=1 Tax=Perca fluviatilis TaxID=8168 RepID=A0A6A5FLA6_PERFL|nr:hypothetical protein PFLUV_G00015710 [Perca fluviatilis]
MSPGRSSFCVIAINNSSSYFHLYHNTRPDPRGIFGHLDTLEARTSFTNRPISTLCIMGGHSAVAMVTAGNRAASGALLWVFVLLCNDHRKGPSTKIRSNASWNSDDDDFQQGRPVLQNISQLLNQTTGVIRKRSRAERSKKAERGSSLPLQKRQCGAGVLINPCFENQRPRQPCESPQLFGGNVIPMPSRVRRIRKTTIGEPRVLLPLKHACMDESSSTGIAVVPSFTIETLNAVADLQRVHPGSEELFAPSLDASDFPERQRDAPQQFLQWGDVAELQDIAGTAVPRDVIAPIQELPQSGAEEAPFEGESKESSETDRTSISPEQEACQCHGNEGDVECDCVCYIPNTPISQRPKAKVIPQAHATSDVSVNTEDIDEAFQCGQVLDCSSTNSSLEAVDHINRPAKITVVEDEALFEFCAKLHATHRVKCDTSPARIQS